MVTLKEIVDLDLEVCELEMKLNKLKKLYAEENAKIERGTLVKSGRQSLCKVTGFKYGHPIEYILVPITKDGKPKKNANAFTAKFDEIL